MDQEDRELRRCGYDVADQYRDGMWPELAGKPWKEVREFLVGELRSRCPGRQLDEYSEALGQGLFESR